MNGCHAHMPILARHTNAVPPLRLGERRTDEPGSGGRLQPAPATLTHPEGHTEAFARGEDDAVWSRSRPRSGIWSAWQSLGGALRGEPAAVMTREGRTHLFGLGRDAALWHLWRAAGVETWCGWTSLGGVLVADPVALVNLEGRIELFAPGSDATLLHLRQTAGTPTDWSAWNALDHSLWEL